MKCFADTIKDEAYRYKLFREGVPIFTVSEPYEPKTEEERKKWEESKKRAKEYMEKIEERERREREQREAKNG